MTDEYEKQMEDDETQKIYVKHKIDAEEVTSQFKSMLGEMGLTSLAIMGILAISPPAIGLLCLVMLLITEFIVTREEEDIEAMRTRVEVRPEEEEENE